MIKILINGYYGFANTGDEAVLASIVRELTAAIPGVKLTVLSDQPEETAAAYQVRALNRWKGGTVWRALRESDMFVFGGGSLLQDITGSKSLYYYLSQIITARLAGCRVFLYAQGIGPISQQNRRRTASALRRCHLITVRDQESADFLLDLGLPAAKIIVTADPVLNAKFEDMPPPLPGGKKLGLALRPWPGLDLPALAALADQASAWGWQVVLLPFHEPADRKIAGELIDKLKYPAYLPPDPISSGGMMAAIAELDFLLGMRLHSLIMAAAGGVPFAAISYDPKIDSFCRQSAQPVLGPCINLGKDAGSNLSYLLENREASRRRLQDRRQNWQDLCQITAILARETAFGNPDLNLDMARKQLEQNRY